LFSFSWDLLLVAFSVTYLPISWVLVNYNDLNTPLFRCMFTWYNIVLKIIPIWM
jgi:hypothetical protein